MSSKGMTAHQAQLKKMSNISRKRVSSSRSNMTMHVLTFARVSRMPTRREKEGLETSSRPWKLATISWKRS